MGAPELDRTAIADRLDLIEATSDFLAATESRELARKKLVQLSRRIVADPTLSDEEIVPAAYALARELHAELAEQIGASGV